MRTYRGQHVFVTGAGGFIASHLVNALVLEGAHVRALVRYTSHGGIGHLAALPKDILDQVEVVYGDVRDSEQMRRYCCISEDHPFTECDTIFHLAALIGIPYSYEAPESYYETNVRGTLNILEGARSARCRRIIITSTSEVYGTAQYVPMDEKHPLQAQSPYSASKIAADKLAESYHKTFGLPIVTVRPFNTYGPRQSERAILPTILSQLDGDCVKLGDTSPIRDMVYVTDTVQGFLAAGRVEEAIGQTINLGTGFGTTIGDLAKMVMEAKGKVIPIETDAQRIRPDASEVRCLVANAKKAETLLGWKPQVSLAEGIKKVIEYGHKTLREKIYAI